MSESAGRRRAETGSSRRGGGLFGGSAKPGKGAKPVKGGKRAARPGTDTQSIPAFVEYDVPEPPRASAGSSAGPAMVKPEPAPAAAPTPTAPTPTAPTAPAANPREPEQTVQPAELAELAGPETKRPAALRGALASRLRRDAGERGARSAREPRPSREPRRSPEPRVSAGPAHEGAGETASPVPAPSATASATPDPAATSTPAPTPVPTPAAKRTTPVRPRPHTPRRPGEVRPVPTAELVVWTVGIAIGFALLIVGNGLDTGPRWLGGIGSLIVTIAYVWVLVSRTGGRPLVFCAVTLVGGVLTLILDRPELNTGAAAVVAAAAAVLGVVITVPAVRIWAALREAGLAVVVAGGGAVATLGWRPEVDLGRFEYSVLVMALVCAFTLVYRLGAGLHGLGRRGVVIVLVGAGVLLVTLLYAEALRHWADVGITAAALDAVQWCRDHLGAFPRPLVAVLGVPALVWGTHMRARRRQGWWVCAFGVAGTAAVSIALMNSDLGVIEVALSLGYGVLIGAAIGVGIIRVDLALTGSGRGRPAVGRRGRRSEEQENAVRPEPKRTGALL